MQEKIIICHISNKILTNLGVLEAVLDRQNSVEQFFSSNSYFLTPLLKLLGTKKHCQKSIQNHKVHLTPKMKTFTVAYIS